MAEVKNAASSLASGKPVEYGRKALFRDFWLAFLTAARMIRQLDMSSEATESMRLVNFLAWLEVNKKRLLVGVIIVAALAGGYSIYRWRENEAEAEANEALLKLHKAGNRLESATGPGAQAYLQVAAAHAGTGAGARALLFAAETLFLENKYSEARTEFEKFIRNYGDSPDVTIAAFGVAACLDALDKTNEAMTAYQDVITRYGTSAVAGQAKLAIARFYEARNEPAQALKIYEELTRPTAQTAWTSEASMRRELLLQKNPELLRTNAPSAATPVSSLAGATNLLSFATNLPAATSTLPTKP
jgi:TolA-binding protein